MPNYGFGDPLLDMAISRSGLGFLQNGFPEHFSSQFGRGNYFGNRGYMGGGFGGRGNYFGDGLNFGGRDYWGNGGLLSFSNGRFNGFSSNPFSDYYRGGYNYDRGYDFDGSPYGFGGSSYFGGRNDFNIQLMDGVAGGSMNYGAPGSRLFSMISRDLARGGFGV